MKGQLEKEGRDADQPQRLIQCWSALSPVDPRQSTQVRSALDRSWDLWWRTQLLSTTRQGKIPGGQLSQSHSPPSPSPISTLPEPSHKRRHRKTPEPQSRVMDGYSSRKDIQPNIISAFYYNLFGTRWCLYASINNINSLQAVFTSVTYVSILLLQSCLLKLAVVSYFLWWCSPVSL